MTKTLLALLFAFLRPAVEDTPPADNPPADTPPGDTPPDTDQLDLDLDAAGAGDTPPSLANADDLETERRARQEATERAERAEREAAELRLRQSAPPQSGDPDADLRKIIDDPAADAPTKWKASADLTLRQNNRVAQGALFQAEDLRDQTLFQTLSTSQPAIFKRYSGRVEEELGKLRARGQNASRAAILRYMLGDDMISGKLKKKVAAPAGDGKPATRGVDRRPPPQARSDTSGRGTPSRRDALRAKLENVQI